MNDAPPGFANLSPRQRRYRVTHPLMKPAPGEVTEADREAWLRANGREPTVLRCPLCKSNTNVRVRPDGGGWCVKCGALDRVTGGLGRAMTPFEEDCHNFSMQGMSNKDIAEALGGTVSTVTSALQRIARRAA